MARILTLVAAALTAVGCSSPTAPTGTREDVAKAKSALQSASKAPTQASKRLAAN